MWEFQGGEYCKTQFRLPQRAWCDFSKAETFHLTAIWKTANFPPQAQCPIPKGKYYIKNFTPDPEKLPEFLNGRYMIKITTERVGDSSELYIKCFIELNTIQGCNTIC